MINESQRLNLNPTKVIKYFGFTGIMSNITFYFNVILNTLCIPVFFIVVEKYHGSIIASTVFNSFNLNVNVEYHVLAHFLIMAGWYPPEVYSSQWKKKNSNSWNSNEFISWIEVHIRFEEGKIADGVCGNPDKEHIFRKSLIWYLSRILFYWRSLLTQ